MPCAKTDPTWRLLTKVRVSHSYPGVPLATPCWEWHGYTGPNGYGYFAIDRNVVRLAHRTAYELFSGAIPEGLQLDHLCRNRACCNPDHLEPVTSSDNNRRGESGSWARPDHCKHGHPFDEKNTRMYRGWRQCRACDRIRNRRTAQYTSTILPRSEQSIDSAV